MRPVVHGRSVHSGVCYQGLKPAKGAVKEEQMCPCKKKDAACLLRGQGRSQHGGEAAWQALAPVPKPLLGTEGGPMPIHPGMLRGLRFADAERGNDGGSWGYRRAANSAAAAVANLSRGEAFQVEVRAAQRRPESAKRKAERVDDQVEVENQQQEKQLEEMKALIAGVVMTQQAQGEVIAKVNSTVNEQMTALATIRGEAQEA
ncbi:unnamed protein product, partial [Prorocentrum cordatum]